MRKIEMQILNDDLLAILSIFTKNEIIGLSKSVMNQSSNTDLAKSINTLVNAGYLKSESNKIYYQDDFHEILNGISNNELSIIFSSHATDNKVDSITLYVLNNKFITVESYHSAPITKLSLYENRKKVINDILNKLVLEVPCSVEIITRLKEYLISANIKNFDYDELTLNTKLLSIIKLNLHKETQYLYLGSSSNYVYKYKDNSESILKINKLDEFVYSLLN